MIKTSYSLITSSGFQDMRNPMIISTSSRYNKKEARLENAPKMEEGFLPTGEKHQEQETRLNG